jgi:putative ATPase
VDQTYLPEGLEEKVYYEPTEHGYEKKIKDGMKKK